MRDMEGGLWIEKDERFRVVQVNLEGGCYNQGASGSVFRSYNSPSSQPLSPSDKASHVGFRRARAGVDFTYIRESNY